MAQGCKPKFSDESIDEMVSLYSQGLSAAKIALKFGCTHSTVTRYLHQREVGVRSGNRVGSCGRPRQHVVNEQFFDVIDTEEKAYWLGFFTADGNVYEPTYRVALELTARDVDHLVKYVRDLESGAPFFLTEYLDGPTPIRSIGVAIGSKYLFYSLGEKGVHPRKSVTATPCRDVPDNLRHHYWRGLVDGDGCIMFDQLGRTPSISIGLTGTPAICEGFRQFGVSCGIAEDSGNLVVDSGCSDLTYSGTSATQMVELLYGDATLYLDRKYALYQKFCEGCEEKYSREYRIACDYLGGDSSPVVASRYDCSYRAVLDYVAKFGGQVRDQKTAQALRIQK